MKFAPIALLLAAAGSLPGAVTPTNLNRSRYTNTVTITATGTAAILDGAPFPTGVATVVTAIGYHELTVTDGTTTTYAFIVRNSERGSTEDGIPTMKPFRYVLDAPSAFADATLNLMVPQNYPLGLPVPVMARLTKGAASGAQAGDPLFLNGIVRADNFPAQPVLLRRGWGSTILPAATVAGAVPFNAAVHGRTATVPLTFEPVTTWTTKSGNITSSEDWGSNARIDVTATVIVPAGVTLTIGAGTVLRCAPGVEFWVRPGGTVNINGTTANPVTFVPQNTNNLWGGFWLQPQSSGNVARLTATGTIFCCWGANQNWYTTAPAGEPAKNFSRHRQQQPCVAIAPGSFCTLTDAALIGPTGLSQTRGAAFATEAGNIAWTRLLTQRCITGGEQEDSPSFEIDSSAFLEMNEPGVDVDSDAFSDADNDGLYLVPGGNTFNLRKTIVGWTKDDGVDTGADGAGTVNFFNCWFENCIHEGISNSGVGRVPRSYGSVHFNNGQGMECGYGGPQSLMNNCAVIGNMVGARYGDNYGSNSGSNGSGTSQYDGTMTTDGSLLLYNYFHDSWAIDFSRWTYQNQRFIMLNTKVSKAGDLAVQNGTEDSNNSLWNPAADGALLAPFMPTPGSAVGMNLIAAKRQDTTSVWPGAFTARLSTFSSQAVSATWKVAGKDTPEDPAETVIATGSLTWVQGETLKTFTASLPVPNTHGVIVVSLESPQNAELTGGPLLFFPPAGSTPGDLTLVAKNAGGWDYHSAVLTSTLPATDSGGRSWTHPDFTSPAPWYANRTMPAGWGAVTTSTNGTLAFGATIIERPVTVYFRKTFTIADPAQVQSLLLECMADDGAAAYINGVRVSPTTWGLDPGTQVGGTIPYSQLSSRFRGNNTSEANYDTLTLSGATLPVLYAAPALNVLAVEVHQNSVDSSDCAFDASLVASFSAPSQDKWGLGKYPAGNYLYWTNPAWTLEMSNNLGQWAARPDQQSPVPIVDLPARQFYRLRIP